VNKLIKLLVVAVLFISCTRSDIDATPQPTPIPVPGPPPIVDTAYAGDGSSNLVISGSYKPGTLIIVKPGTYDKGLGITLESLSNVTVQLTGVILDGLNKTKPGYYNVLNLNNLTNVLITGGTTINNGYHHLYINGKTDGLILKEHTFINSTQGFVAQAGLVWDGTDKTVFMMNSAFKNCSFINCDGGGNFGEGINAAQQKVTDLVKNFTFSGCKWKGGNPGTMFFFSAVDSAFFYNNVIDSVNLSLTNDNRLLVIIGNSEVHDNVVTNIQGHFAAEWAASFGSIIKTSHFYKNTCNGSLKYSSFEFQEFKEYNIPGKTTIGHLVVSDNTCSNLNTERHKEFDANFIDNYEYGLMGGHVTLTNNSGKNFFPIPQPGVFWNLAKPLNVSGNTYQY
jgi:hypothetical protein